MRCDRGAAIPETALTIGVGLTILLFAVQVGILGFLQITADSASFVDARYHALSQPSPGMSPVPNASAEAATHAIFNQIAPGDITGSPSPAPSATFPVDYGYNTGSSTVRHGGVTMLEPEQYSAVVSPHGMFSSFQKNLGVVAQDIEPMWVECGPHYNVQGSSSTCGAASEPVNFAVNYFNSGENVPPYYVGFNFMRHCTSTAAGWSTCGSTNTNFLSLGVAEVLDVDNWGTTNNGADGTGTNGAQPYSTFEWMACHQRVYSALGQFFNAYPNFSSLYGAFQNQIVYGAGGAGVAPVTDYSQWNEFNTSYPPVPSANDRLVDEVYSWDAKGIANNATLDLAPSNIGGAGSVALSPGTGC